MFRITAIASLEERAAMCKARMKRDLDDPQTQLEDIEQQLRELTNGPVPS